jgi:hypothetical protein
MKKEQIMTQADYSALVKRCKEKGQVSLETPETMPVFITTTKKKKLDKPKKQKTLTNMNPNEKRKLFLSILHA